MQKGDKRIFGHSKKEYLKINIFDEKRIFGHCHVLDSPNDGDSFRSPSAQDGENGRPWSKINNELTLELKRYSSAYRNFLF